MDNIYRVKRSEYWGLLLPALFFAIIVIVATIGGIVESQHLSFYLFPAFFLGMCALSFSLSFYYYRLDLRLERNRIIKRSWRTETTLLLSDIKSCRWGRARTVGIEGAAGKIVIELRLYESNEQLSIIRYLRMNVSEALQRDWPIFCHRVALRLRESRSDRAPGPGEIRITRQRYDRLAIVIALFCVPLGVTAWRLTDNLAYLAAPLASLPGWALLRFTTPKEGHIDKRIMASRESGLIFLTMGSGLAATIVWAVTRGGDAPLAWPDYVFVALALASIFGLGHLADRSQKRREARELDGSIERWEAGEAANESSACDEPSG